MAKYVCDFETTTDPDDCRVWAWAMVEVGKTYVVTGNSLADFMNAIIRLGSNSYYFHNLKFDGEFILYWLLNNGYTFQPVKARELNNKEFSALIDISNTWYNIAIKTAKGTVMIYDSLKLIPISVEEMAAAFGLSFKKLKLNYDTYRPPGHELTPHEKAYISNDVVIVSLSLQAMFDRGLNKMTISSCALHDYKKSINKSFKSWYPQLEDSVDEFCRNSYKGGYVYCNPRFANKIYGKGIVLDVHSMYPGVLMNEILPYGKPVYFSGEYTPNKNFPLYIQRFTCQFEIKPGHIPTIQIKRNLAFVPTEYLTSSGNEVVELTLTNVDLELMKQHYKIFNVTYLDGYKFHGAKHMFDKYVTSWFAEKDKARQEGNKGLYFISKRMLNALTGKFGTSGKAWQKVPKIKGGSLNLTDKTYNIKKTVYVPLISFVTSYGRRKTIQCAQANIERYLYSDTDSCHFLGHEIPQGIKVTEDKLYTWGVEHKFIKCKYLRAKTYMFTENNKITVKCAGLPKASRTFVTYDNFKKGQTYGGKLRPVHVKGGIVLKETTFKIKD